MELLKFVKILDEEFQINEINENWQELFDELFVQKSTVEFKRKMRNSGLMIKNSDEINKIYTAFSPSRYILEEIQMKGIVNTLLIAKSPFLWDGSKKGKGFIHFTDRDYQLMEGMGISIYLINTPLNINRKDFIVSSAHAFASIIKLKTTDEFGNEKNNPGKLIGLIGHLNERDVKSLSKRISSKINYKVKVIQYDENVGKIAMVTGKGFNIELLREAKLMGANTYITGAITPNYSQRDKLSYPKVLAEVKKLEMNIIGCSNYLTEKWCMQSLTTYLARFGKAEFIEDKDALTILE